MSARTLMFIAIGVLEAMNDKASEHGFMSDERWGELNCVVKGFIKYLRSESPLS